MADEPIHSRDHRGRHKVNLRNIRSPLIRYGISLIVVAIVAGLAIVVGGRRVSDETVEWFVPWLGWGVIALLVIALALRFIGRRR